MKHLLVIGAQRCGTSYLATLLDEHPQIAMAHPARPEPKVFLDPDKWGRGLDWYHATFFAEASSPDIRLFGEKSTSYLEQEGAAQAAAEVLGTAQIVVMLRDPLERAVSNWRFSSEHGLEDRPLEQALRDNLEGERAWDAAVTSVSPFAYLERGRYADYIQPWLERFPTTMHVLFTEEVVAREEAVGRLFAALGVDGSFRPSLLRERVNAADGSVPDLDHGLAAALRESFRDSDARLRELVGRTLPWDQG